MGGDGSRVAGIDVTFSAPKSVSALWAVGSPHRRAQIEAAHRQAVASAIARIEREVELVRGRGYGALRWERAQSLFAAEFVHTYSRLTRAQEGEGVPDPQLYSHVLVVAAERMDGRLVAPKGWVCQAVRAPGEVDAVGAQSSGVGGAAIWST